MKQKSMAYVYLAGALLLGALMPVMLGIAAGQVNIYAFLFLAYLISIPPSIAFVLLSKRAKFFLGYLRNRRDFALIAVIGLLNYAFLEYGLLYAEQYMSASLATVIYRTYPLLMLLFIPFILRERITKYQVAALSIAFAGLFVAISYGNSQFLGGAGYIPIAAVVIIALANALATTLVKRYTYDMQSSILIFNLSNLAFFGALFFLNGGNFGYFSMRVIAAAVYVGLFYNVLTGFMYYRSLRSLKTTFVTNLYFLSPFLTFVAAGLVLGEPIEAYYVIVAVMVAAGVLIQKLDRKEGEYVQRRKSSAGNVVIYDVTPAYSNTDNETLHAYVKGGGRALAIRVPYGDMSRAGMLLEDSRKKAEQYGAIMYTDADYPFERGGEIEHIREICGALEGDSVLICAGKPEHGEELLNRIYPDIYGRRGFDGDGLGID